MQGILHIQLLNMSTFSLNELIYMIYTKHYQYQTLRYYYYYYLQIESLCT